jgi:hypothetical protein
MQYRYTIAERFTYHFVIAVWRAKKAESRPLNYWEIIADNIKKRVELGAGSQRWIARGDQSGLPMRIGRTESILLFNASKRPRFVTLIALVKVNE